jgi:hypothetical protein
LLCPAWLGLVVKQAEQAELVVLYYLLSFFGLYLPEYLAEPGGVRAQTRHHVRKYASSAAVSLPMAFPVEACHVH